MTDSHLFEPPPGPSERANGLRTGSSPGRSAPLPQPTADRTAATAHTTVSALDRLTLQLGVVVATVIAICSYAVSATSLYALGVGAGYSWWQAAAVPVVADGPAIYGMFRIISRSRRGARGAGYGWLLSAAARPPRSAATSPTPNPTWSPRPLPPLSPWPCWPCWKD
jgi:hypothetical protein